MKIMGRTSADLDKQCLEMFGTVAQYLSKGDASQHDRTPDGSVVRFSEPRKIHNRYSKSNPKGESSFQGAFPFLRSNQRKEIAYVKETSTCNRLTRNCTSVISQIFCFTTCPLKHRFQYVEGRPPERISIVLPFGSAIHSAIEMAYMSLKNHGRTEPLEALCERFDTCLELDLENSVVPVIFKKDLPDHKGAVEMGNAMLKVFHESIPRSSRDVRKSSQWNCRSPLRFTPMMDSPPNSSCLASWTS